MAVASPVAQESLAYCTSCKMDLNHVIVAMKGDKIVKVKCLTCEKTHAYRSPKGVKEPKATKKRSAAKAVAVPVEDEWQKLMDASKGSTAKVYTTKIALKLGERISHTTFGQGVVGKLIYPNKVEVVFQSNIKILIHAGLPES